MIKDKNVTPVIMPPIMNNPFIHLGPTFIATREQKATIDIISTNEILINIKVVILSLLY